MPPGDDATSRERRASRQDTAGTDDTLVVRGKRRRHGAGAARLLRESEARYRALAEAAGGLVWVTSSEGLIGDDGAWAAFTGQTPEQARGRGWLNAVRSEDRARVEAAWAEGIAGGRAFTLYVRARRADGTYRLLQCRAVPVPDGHEEGNGGAGAGAGDEGYGADEGAGADIREWVVVAQDVTARARRERALAGRTHAEEVARERLDELLESLADGFLAMDAAGHITYVNRAFERVVGMGREALLGRNVWEAFPEAVGLAFEREYHRVMETRAAAFFEAYYPPLGLWLEARLYPAPGGVAAYFGDITERKRAEDERARQLEAEQAARAEADAARRAAATGNARFSKLMESNVIGIVVSDADRILEANDAYLAMLGYTREELDAGAIRWRDITSEAEHEAGRRALEAALARGAGRPLRGALLEREFLRKDGSRVPVLVSVVEVEREPLSMLCFVLDLSERKRLERELAARARALATLAGEAARRSQELEILIDSLADGVLVYDAEGRVVEMNRCARELLGLDEEGEEEVERFRTAPIGQRFRRYTLRDAEGRELGPGGWPGRRVLGGEVLSGPETLDLLLELPDGRERALSITGAPLRDARGRPSGAVLVLRDVTERRALERQRTDILRTVAHDLANPLAATKLYLQMQERRMQKGLAPKAPDPEAIESLSHALSRMERLLQDLRAAASIEKGGLRLELAPVDLAALCRREADLQREATGREVTLDLPEGPVVALADGERIGQVLGNLLSNAVKYSPPDRPVRLTLRREEGGLARAAVTDEGPGIPPREQARIWEQFHRAEGIQAQHGFGEGLGLGLYISRSIIEQHGGEIGVESAPGAGSTFWFTLAFAGEEEKPAQGPTYD